MLPTVAAFLRQSLGMPADELPDDGGMASSDWDAAQRPSAPTDWSQPVQPQPDYQLADGRTAPPTPGGVWEPVQTVPNPQRPVAADPGQWLAEDSVSAVPAPPSTRITYGRPLETGIVQGPADPTPAQPSAGELIIQSQGGTPGVADMGPEAQRRAVQGAMQPHTDGRPAVRPQPVYRQEPAEEAAASVQIDQTRRMVDDPLDELEQYGEAGRRIAAELRRAQRNPDHQTNAWEITEALMAVPFDVVTRARRAIISDREAKRATGTDPLAPWRGTPVEDATRAAAPTINRGLQAIGIPADWSGNLPDAEMLNPEGRAAGDLAIAGGLTAAAPDPFDPIAGRVLGAAGRVGQATGRRVGQEVATLRYGAEMAGRAAGRALEGAGDARLPQRQTSLGSGLVPEESRRFYHGTASEFATPDPASSERIGIYGPGYYLSDSPELASDYAVNRAIQNAPDVETPTGANVRAVNVPSGVKLFDMDGRARSDAFRVISALKAAGDTEGADIVREIARADGRNLSGGTLFDAIREAGYSDAEVQGILRKIGYDGLTYNGQATTPLSIGQRIVHRETMIFPESLPKIRNAFSGEAGGSGFVPTRSDLRNAAQGGVLGAASEATSDEELTPQERLARIVGGGALGVGAGRRAGRQAGRRLVDPGLDGSLRAPNTGQAAGVAEDVLAAQQPRALPAPPAQQALPPPQEGGQTWREFSQTLDTPERRAAREAAAAPVSRASAEDAPVREQFGRPWEEVYGPNRAINTRDESVTATDQLLDEGQSWRGPRNRVLPSEREYIGGPVRIEPQSINLNSAAGGLVGAGSGGLTGEEEGEFDPQRAAMGAVIGAVAGPGAARGKPPRRQLRSKNIPGQQAIKASDAAEAGRLRLDKFPPEVRDLIEAGAREQDWARTQRRGVLPDNVVQQMADDDAASVDRLIKSGKAGKAYNAEETVALRNAVASQAATVRQLSDEIAEARANGMTPDLLIARRAAEATRLQGLIKVAEGARAEAGRALRQYRQQARLIELNPDQAMEQIYRRLGGKEAAGAAVDEYTKLVQDGANPIQLAKFWAKIENGEIKGSDLFALYRRFNMLSGPRTFEVNALSGAVNLGYEVATQALGQVARGRLTEAAAEFGAPFKAMGRAFQNMAETARYGVSEEQALRGDIPRTLSSRTDNKAAKGALTVMEIPDRINAATDQFFRTMTEDWAATMLAHRQARNTERVVERATGTTRVKLTPRSPEWAETVAKNLEAIRDDPSKFPEIKQMADHVTFSEEPGAIGKGLEAFRNNAPVVANLLFPFIRTPYNIASRAVDLSPLGPVRTGIEAATGTGRGTTNISRRLRDNAIGLGATYWAYEQAVAGNVTGAGPDDPEKLAQLRATGWQPYSIKIGDQYWSYANFAPFSLALSMGAAIHESKKYAKDGKTDTLSLLADGAARTAKVVTDMTVLAGIGAIVKSIQDPDRYGGQWLTQFLQTLIPAGSALNTVGQAMDPNIRRAERDTFANQVQGGLLARIPPNPITPDRMDVPAAQDPLGRPIPNDQQGIGALNPFRPTTERPDPTLQAFIDAGVDIGKPKENLTLRPGAPQIPLTPAEQRRWNELRGEQLQQVAPQVSRAVSYQQAGRQGQEAVLRRLLNNAANAADAKLAQEIGNAELRRRLTEAAQKKAS